MRHLELLDDHQAIRLPPQSAILFLFRDDSQIMFQELHKEDL